MKKKKKYFKLFKFYFFKEKLGDCRLEYVNKINNVKNRA